MQDTTGVSKARRRRQAIAALAAVSVGGLALTACSSSASPSSSSNGTGTLTVSLPAAPQSLNPGVDGNGGQNIVQWLSYEPLIWAQPDGSFKPGLATSWKYVGTGNTQFELQIRDGAKFADGTAVTGESVANTISYYLKNPGPLSHYLTGITGATAAGSTVTVKLTAANPILPLVFSQAANWGDVISPAGLAAPDQLTQKTFGAGAYVLDGSATVAGDHYTFTKNANYWNPSAQHYSKVVVKVIGDTNSALQSLTSGQTQVAIGASPTLADQAKSQRLQVNEGNASVIGLFLFDRAGVTAKALGDVRVRQAINYAIDRDSIAKALGSAYTATDQIVPKDGDGYDSSLAGAYPFDVAKAKSLLADAGYPDGFTMKLVDVSLNGADTLSQAVVQQLASVGIKVQLSSDATDLNKFIADMASKTFGAATFGTGGPMFANALQNFAAPTSPLNPFKSQGAEVLGAFQALGTASGDDVKSAAVALNKAVSEQAWFAPVADSSNYTFAATSVQNLGSMGTSGELNVLDWS